MVLAGWQEHVQYHTLHPDILPVMDNMRTPSPGVSPTHKVPTWPVMSVKSQDYLGTIPPYLPSFFHDFLLEGTPFLYSWDFSVFFTTASTTTLEWSPIQVLTLAQVAQFSCVRLRTIRIMIWPQWEDLLDKKCGIVFCYLSFHVLSGRDVFLALCLFSIVPELSVCSL